MKVLTAAQMRDVDRLTTERYGLPGIQLMENAASSVVDAIERRLGSLPGKRALVICGKGNNGGDGGPRARPFHFRGGRGGLVFLGTLHYTPAAALPHLNLAPSLS